MARQKILTCIFAVILLGAVAWGVWFYREQLQGIWPENSPILQASLTPPISRDGCVAGGCSGEICQDASAPPAVSICIYKEEYACFSKTRCERQSDGKCGWTQTPEFTACVASARRGLTE